jgi:hypothetical protein
VQQVDLASSAVHVRIGPATPLRPETVARIPKLFEGASFTPQGVLRIPVLSASRPLALLGEILSALEVLAEGHSQ